MTKKTRRYNKPGGTKAKNQGAPPAGSTDLSDEARREEIGVDPKALIWQVVAMIPKGKVASYGQIAALIGFPSHARYVGATLRNLPKGSKLPWHRVVNSSLRISLRGGGEVRQKALLESEGVTFIGARIPKAFKWEAQAD